MDGARLKAFRKLGIGSDRKTILCLDGGGVRGIMTLQLLIELEKIAGIPCYRLFDMVAGTSTGSIIAGLIASGKDANFIADLYKEMAQPIFTHRPWGFQLLNPPTYTKKNYRKILSDKIKNVTLKSACDQTGIDLLITSKDISAGEETFFSYIRKRVSPKNTYENILLRACMEATMSAPTYFTSFNRFVDGGVTTYNNPSLGAIIEASQYAKDAKGKPIYPSEKLTVFSFGTGCSLYFVDPKEAMKKTGPLANLFWLNWLMGETSDDSSDMQTYLLRSNLISGLEYRRFQISMDRKAIKKLPNLTFGPIEGLASTTLWDLTKDDLSNMGLDGVKYVPLLETIGKGMVSFIKKVQKNPFNSDLIGKNGSELLVTREGDVEQIKQNLKSPAWIDKEPD